MVLQRGHSGDVCDLGSTLCKYDLRKGALFALSWPMNDENDIDNDDNYINNYFNNQSVMICLLLL